VENGERINLRSRCDVAGYLKRMVVMTEVVMTDQMDTIHTVVSALLSIECDINVNKYCVFRFLQSQSPLLVRSIHRSDTRPV
jgi:hypothetical protein